MSKEQQLIQYRGQLKYLKGKYLKRLNLIDDYISRIDTETAKEKEEQLYEYEKEQNKDLIIELETFFKDLGE